MDELEELEIGIPEELLEAMDRRGADAAGRGPERKKGSSKKRGSMNRGRQNRRPRNEHSAPKRSAPSTSRAGTPRTGYVYIGLLALIVTNLLIFALIYLGVRSTCYDLTGRFISASCDHIKPFANPWVVAIWLGTNIIGWWMYEIYYNKLKILRKVIKTKRTKFLVLTLLGTVWTIIAVIDYSSTSAGLADLLPFTSLLDTPFTALSTGDFGWKILTHLIVNVVPMIILVIEEVFFIVVLPATLQHLIDEMKMFKRRRWMSNFIG